MPEHLERTIMVWFTLAYSLAGLLGFAAAAAPESVWSYLAAAAGHSDRITPERLSRLRFLCVVLSGCHLMLVGIWFRYRSSLVAPGGTEVSLDALSAASRLRRFASAQGPGHTGSLILLVATGTVIRLWYLNLPMEYDEAYSFINFASRSLLEAVSDYNTTNNHLLNTVFMNLEAEMMGPQEWSLRLHTLVAGIAVIPLTYGLGRLLSTPDCGLFAAALVAANPALVNYSVNARGYILVAMFSLLLALSIVRLAREECASDWLMACHASVLGLFALPIMVYAVVPAWTFLLGRGILLRRPVRPILWFGITATGTLWLYLPGLVYRGSTAWNHPFVRPIADWSHWLSRAPYSWLFALRCWLEGPLPWYVLGALFVAGSWGLVREQKKVGAVVAGLFMATAMIMTIQRVTPPPRIFVPWAPFALIAVAAAATRLTEKLGRQWLPPALVVGYLLVAVGVAGYQRAPGGAKPVFNAMDVGEIIPTEKGYLLPGVEDQLWRFSVKDAVRFLGRNADPADPVLVALPADLPVHFYADRQRRDLRIGATPEAGDRIWLVLRSFHDPKDVFETNPTLRQYRGPWLRDGAWETAEKLEFLTIWRSAR